MIDSVKYEPENQAVTGSVCENGNKVYFIVCGMLRSKDSMIIPTPVTVCAWVENFIVCF